MTAPVASLPAKWRDDARRYAGSEEAAVAESHARDLEAALASAAPSAGVGVEWAVLQIGATGSAYDPPNTHRAFTYERQPGNVIVSNLGGATMAAASASAGDSIDRGLNLLKALQEAGYGVFQIAALQHPAAPSVSPAVASGFSRAWDAVTATLTEVAPGWDTPDGTCDKDRACNAIRRLATAEQPIEWDGATRTMQEHLYVMTGERDRYRMRAEQQAEKVARLEQRIAEQPGSAVQGEVESLIAKYTTRRDNWGKRSEEDAVHHAHWMQACDILADLRALALTTPPSAPFADMNTLAGSPEWRARMKATPPAPAAEQGDATCDCPRDHRGQHIYACPERPLAFGLHDPAVAFNQAPTQPEARGVERCHASEDGKHSEMEESPGWCEWCSEQIAPNPVRAEGKGAVALRAAAALGHEPKVSDRCTARVVPTPASERPPGPSNPPVWCCLKAGHEGPHRCDGGGMYASLPFRKSDKVEFREPVTLCAKCRTKWPCPDAATLIDALAAAPSGVRVDDRIDLWFFRDLTNEQRLALFSVMGIPVNELSTTSDQRIGLATALAGKEGAK